LDTNTHILRLPDVSITRQLGVIHHVQRTLSNAARAFMALLAEHGDAPLYDELNKKRD
jgi:hypothetical protein